MHKVSKVTALCNYRLHVEFDDGTAGEIDLSDRLFGPVFEPLRDEVEFQKVAVDEFGASHGLAEQTWPRTPFIKNWQHMRRLD